MCTGLEIAALASAGAAVAGAGVGVKGQIETAKAQQKIANYNAEVMNAQAKAVEQKAKYDEGLHRDQVKKILSAQRAEYGTRGIDPGTGSPVLVRQDTVKQGEMDALAIRYGGDVEAALARSKANLIRMEGQNRKSAGYYKAGTTLLSGASDIAKSYLKYSTAIG